MNNGAGILNISVCKISEFVFVVSFGKELQFDDKFYEQTFTTTALHFYMEYSQITSSFIYMEAKKYYSFMAIIVKSCIWSDSYMRKSLDGGIVSIHIENCSFIQITKDKDIGMEFKAVLQFIIINLYVEANGQKCMLGCVIYVEGTDIVNRYIPNLRTILETVGCPFRECNYTISKLLIEDTTITGNIHSAGSVIYSKNLILEMMNCTFNMNSVSVEGGILHHASLQMHQHVKMINITTNVSSVMKPTTVFAISGASTEIHNVLILCSQSLHAVKKERAETKLYKCEYSCPKEFYTIDTVDMLLNEKYKEPLNSSGHISHIICFPCPVGAFCDNHIKVLPNYYGFKTANAKDITMVRCPDSYCCSDNETCKTFNSCNTGRIGTLCGSCENNLTESLFSAKCISHENCYTMAIFILYLLLVLIYGVGLLVFQIVKRNISFIGISLWRIMKNYFYCFNRHYHREFQRVPGRTDEELCIQIDKFKNKHNITNEYGIEVELHEISNSKGTAL